MDANELKHRTRAFALSIIRFVQTLPHYEPATTLGKQLLRCGTSVGANYRAACRARSRLDFIGKLKIVEEECDESIYWMELLSDAGIVKREAISKLVDEAGQLLSIIVASVLTAKKST